MAKAYRLFFNSPTGLIVFNDLMRVSKFRQHVTCDIDEGMRRLFLRIIEMSQLTDEQLIALYAHRKMMEKKSD